TRWIAGMCRALRSPSRGLLSPSRSCSFDQGRDRTIIPLAAGRTRAHHTTATLRPSPSTISDRRPPGNAPTARLPALLGMAILPARAGIVLSVLGVRGLAHVRRMLQALHLSRIVEAADQVLQYPGCLF